MQSSQLKIHSQLQHSYRGGKSVKVLTSDKSKYVATQHDKERSVVEQDKNLLSKESSVSVSTLTGDNWKGITTNYECSGDRNAHSDHLQDELANSPQSLKSELRVFLRDFTLTDDILHKKREWL